jgi:hypothetical protein
MKNRNERSLRWQVEKWLAPAPATPVQVTRFSRTRLGGRRCVSVETSSSRGVRALFFMHDDGSWYVFPPAADRPRVSFSRIVARHGFQPDRPVENGNCRRSATATRG